MIDTRYPFNTSKHGPPIVVDKSKFPPNPFSPKHTVFIMTYNRPHLIHLAIESLLQQTEESWEALIFNDSSRDNGETDKAVLQYDDPRIRYYVNVGPNQGFPCGINWLI